MGGYAPMEAEEIAERLSRIPVALVALDILESRGDNTIQLMLES